MAKKHDERIQFEPEGPGSAAWRAILRQAIDGRPWLIVTRTQGGDEPVKMGFGGPLV